MIKALLATKVRIPPNPERVLHRSRLIDSLEHHIPNHKLILLAAPAGYGKTTLLAQWAHFSRFQIAWLDVSKEDNDLERFFRYLLEAWERVQPGVREGQFGILLSGNSPDIEDVQTAFINEASNLPAPIVFVLDDLHQMEQTPVYKALSYLLDNLPSKVHFILSGRSEPPLPLARYRARRELFELRAEELLFLPNETGELLNHIMDLNLTQEEVHQVQTQVEGWAAGLQLLALTLHNNPQPPKPVVVRGSQRYIGDYLREDVLAQLPGEMQRFLLQTSILDRVCSQLCDAVTEETGGQDMLESLERKNLFLVPLDDHREWFRYHRLFADFLQSELARVMPQSEKHLHRRAARWYLAHDLPDQAIPHAISGDDAEIMVDIGERYFEIKLLSGEYQLLKGWLDRVPRQWQVDYPIFGLFYGAILLFTGELTAGSHQINRIEQHLLQEGRADIHGALARISAVRCSIACFQNELALAENYASKALQTLPPEDHAFRSIIYHSLGDTYRRNGRWEEARQCYQNALEIVQSPSFHIRSVHIYGALADLELRQGRLRAAAAYWQKALAVIEEPDSWGRFPLPLMGWVYIRMAEILCEWNALEQCNHFLTQGVARVQLSGDVRAVLAGCLVACRLKLALGQRDGGWEHLEQARSLVEQTLFPEWTSLFNRLQIELWLAAENRRAVVEWIDAAQAATSLAPGADDEGALLALARGLFVKGDGRSLAQARRHLEALLTVANEAGRTGVVIEGLMLQALIAWRGGEQADAMISLEHALRLAEPEGYIRLFVDMGLSMARLLQEAQARGVMPEYVNILLANFTEVLPSRGNERQALPEPLTVREVEILQKLAAGLTNREIAEQLVVSPETVKKHTSSIYSKLGVHNRLEAVAKARQLDLLK